jgi:dUTP pyrophosphatase
MTATLELLCLATNLTNYYKYKENFDTDSGIDLYINDSVTFKPGETIIVDLQVKSRMVDSGGNTMPYYLYPRSSISKTPLRMANSVGIIDKDYRGNIKVALTYSPTWELLNTINNSDKPVNMTQFNYILEAGTRVVQICAPSLCPLKVKMVSELDLTKRGEGGFGSTGY